MAPAAAPGGPRRPGPTFRTPPSCTAMAVQRGTSRSLMVTGISAPVTAMTRSPRISSLGPLKVHSRAAAGGEGSGRRARRLAVVDGHGHLGARDGNDPVAAYLEPGATKGTFEGRGVVRVADQPVRKEEGGQIHRPGWRDSVAEIAGAAQVLDRRLRPRLVDHEATHRDSLSPLGRGLG